MAMMQNWDGTEETPLDDSEYAYQSTLTVYDEAGGSHDLTVYFDPVQDATVVSGAGGSTVWEYMVTCNPSEDGRTLGGTDLNTTSGAGLLMTGTLTFDTSGEMVGMTAFTLDATAAGDFLDPANWTPAEFSEEGYPIFTANFSDSDTGDYTGDTDAVNIALDLGLRNTESPPTWDTPTANAAALGNNFANLFSFTEFERDVDATTSFEAAFTTLYQAQDGFATGYLQDISVDRDGVIWANYTNGQTDPLAIIGLADFYNTQGLVLEGGNLYSQSANSGLPTIGMASTARFGNIQPNTLEQSNVDMATEMVRLITIQRGYSANGKVITTADSMLQEAISLKR
ncbi:MAG: flagellar hook-basal body complex protein [Desulfovibrio sp.]|nr:MAG: flagellar hook-basal body complex protein [Desulfovibrio sp.]